MIQAGSLLVISDKTGVSVAECIKVFGLGKRRFARLGEVVLTTVKMINRTRIKAIKKSQAKRFSKGTLHRALLVHNRAFAHRFGSIFIRFGQNGGVLVNKQTIPTSNRVFGPVTRELCIKHLALGSIARFII